MKRMIAVLCLTVSAFLLCGCDQLPEQINAETILQQVETMASQIDVEAIVTDVIERIDWEELKGYARQGYDALTDRYPALKGENVKAFLKENGLSLLNKFLESSDADMQENARKLGAILKILNPELMDEVDAIIQN